MQFVAINWHVYLLTKSAFALGLIGLFRGVPIIICSLAGGVVADAIDRRRLMVVTQTIMLASAGLLTAYTFAGLESVWPIYILSGIASAASAFDVPARQALMPTLVPVEDFPNAVSLGILVFNVATIAGPAVVATLNTRIPKLTAFGKSSTGTSVGMSAWRAGTSNADAADAIPLRM